MTRRSADGPRSPARRRLAAVALGVFGVLGLGGASAGQLNLGGDPLGAGATTIAPCQGSAPIAAIFTTAWYTSGADSYRATAVQLTGINAACNGRGYQFRVRTTTGYLNEENGTVSGGATTNEGITETPVANIVSVVVVIP